MKHHARPGAADYLTEKSGVEITAQTLANLARVGKGPAYGIVNGRAVYAEADLDGWLAAQLAVKRPPARARAPVPA